jgi:hypothetical protein
MSWPLASHFSAMLQNPGLAFRDPVLRRCRIAKDERNQPRPWSGAFAVVYKGLHADGGGAFALRIFTTESPERRERYDNISEYLKGRRLACLVPFEYRDRSIRSAGDGKWYPLIVMDWVEGETLYRWTRAACLAGNHQALTLASQHWLALVKELADAQIAHGDLQHANVMVTPEGRLMLVDYDCMCVPALVGRRNLEVGVEPYQHPQRNATTLLGPDLDHFSALVIYVALRALAADPRLWDRYVEKPAHDKLLFRTEDFQAPDGSPLCHDLGRSPDEEVRELAAKLFELARGPIDRVPPLGYLSNSYAKVEALLRSRLWDAAVALLNRRGQFHDAPEHLKPLIREAYEHVSRQQAWAAVTGVPAGFGEKTDRALIEAWNDSLLAGFEPAEQQRPRLEAARQRVASLDRLRYMIQQSARQIVMAEEQNMVDLADQLPQEYQYSLAPRVERARQRVTVIGQLNEVFRQPAGDSAIIKVWRRVQRKQCQELVPEEYRGRIALAEQRLTLIEALEQIPAGLPADQLDRRMLDLWRDDALRECPAADPWRPAYELAVRRHDAMGRMAAAIDSRNEPAISQAMADPCLEGYPLPASWTTILRTTRERIARTENLVASLREGRRQSFAELFDARIIRQYREQFAPYEAQVKEWSRAEILPLERLGMGPALARASLVCLNKSEGAYRLRWTWPQQRFSGRCLLAVCCEAPGPEDDPRDLAVLHRAAMDRASWEAGGGSRVLHVQPDWAGGYVVVWAEIDLGFCLLYSQPLVLGQLDGGAKRPGGPWQRWQLFSRGGKTIGADASAPGRDAPDNSKGDNP